MCDCVGGSGRGPEWPAPSSFATGPTTQQESELKNAKIRDLMTPEVQTLTAEDNLAEAARRLWDHDCGVIPVVDEELRVKATVTDRDICMAGFTKNRPLSELPISVAMSRTVYTCRPDDSTSEALRIMAERKVRRLPVTDEDGRIQGIISMNDLARAADGGWIDGKRVVATLAEICRPKPVESRA